MTPMMPSEGVFGGLFSEVSSWDVFRLLAVPITFLAMYVAYKITVTYARRPDGMINQYGQAQTVLPDGRVTFPDPNRPGGVVDGYGQPVTATPAPRPVEKPMWLIWLQIWCVAEAAGLFAIGLIVSIA